jgi:hypothetical protein
METIAVFSEIHKKHENKSELDYRLSPYRAINTPREGFNAVWGKSRCLLRDTYKTRK